MGARVLIIGEAIVDVVCEKPIASWDEADSFVPHFGGAPANAAVTAARLGAEVALAGGVGDDHWGRWLTRRLTEENVALDWFGLSPAHRTPVAFVTVDASAEPSYDFLGDRLAPGVATLGDGIADAVDACDAAFFTTNTMLDPDERAVTRAARDRALSGGKPVLYDPNLRIGRWPVPEEAIEIARESIDGALMVKLNRTEAGLLTGSPDPAGAARALLDAGARTVVITLGPDGAIAASAEGITYVEGVPAAPVCTIGAGDTISGVLIAALAESGFHPAASAAALGRAVEAAARATERWGGT